MEKERERDGERERTKYETNCVSTFIKTLKKRFI